MEKIHARQLTLKKFMLTPKKYSYTEFNNEKKFLRPENPPPPPPPPPRNVSNGPSLRQVLPKFFTFYQSSLAQLKHLVICQVTLTRRRTRRR